MSLYTKPIYDFKVKTIDGKQKILIEYQNKVLLIVNVASKCGFTPQYNDLQSLYDRYKDRGFFVLGFPCNQFGQQEQGTEDEIQQFCAINYQITFPLFAKIDVNGPNAHPLYQCLKESKPGILGIEAIKWNFTKFLVNREGDVLKRFASWTKPENLSKIIENVL